MSLIEIKNVDYSYNDTRKAVDGITFDIEKGSYVTIIGHNGSGKSTLAKLITGLLPVKNGSILIDGLEVNEQNISAIRKRLGIVFQNPDNQFIGSTVKDDIAFGLENKQVESADMEGIIGEYAEKVGLTEYLDYEPQNLSGGQKQRVAIAGILAMKPDIIIFDEATSMLDPKGRADVLNTIRALNKDHGISVVLITHFMEEAVYADRVLVIDQAQIRAVGKPREIFSQREMLKECGLELPDTAKLCDKLRDRGIGIRDDILTEEELIAEIIKRSGK